MTTLLAPNLTLRQVLVQGGHSQRALFRVVELNGGITREQIETLLENLPMRFTLRRRDADISLNEPVEVYVHSNIVNIYPPKSRYFSGVSFQSWEFFNITSQMRVDNMMDDNPGHGQLRSCVHFNPAILGISDWPDLGSSDREIEIDIFKYPKSRIAPREIQRIGKSEVLRLLDQLAGGKRSLSLEQFKKFKDIILLAIEGMRLCYENEETAEDYPVRVYYSRQWQSISDAKKDDKKLLEAVEDLRDVIRWE